MPVIFQVKLIGWGAGEMAGGRQCINIADIAFRFKSNSIEGKRFLVSSPRNIY